MLSDQCMTIDNSLDYKLNPCALALLLVVVSMPISTDYSCWHSPSHLCDDVPFKHIEI